MSQLLYLHWGQSQSFADIKAIGAKVSMGKVKRIKGSGTTKIVRGSGKSNNVN